MADECLSEDQKSYIDKSVQVIETRIDGIDRAAILKASEIDRRLEEHNELRKEVLMDRDILLRKDTYNENQKTLEEWKIAVNEKLTKLMTKYESRMSIANWIAIVAVLLTVANLVILILHFKP